jgi:hypothetical protein
MVRFQLVIDCADPNRLARIARSCRLSLSVTHELSQAHRQPDRC